MEYTIVCPRCKKEIVNNAVVADAAKREGSAAQMILCECGERISYWQIADQLRVQNTFGSKFKKWVGSLTGSHN